MFFENTKVETYKDVADIIAKKLKNIDINRLVQSALTSYDSDKWADPVDKHNAMILATGFAMRLYVVKASDKCRGFKED